MKKEDYELMMGIVARASEMNLCMFDTLSLMMDLECATNEFNLRLKDFLGADKFNFVHDICGIQKNLNRKTKKMENCFVPRFAGVN